jgi:NTE family protein
MAKFWQQTSGRHLLKIALGLTLAVSFIILFFTSTMKPFLGSPLGPGANQPSDSASDATPNERSKELLVFMGFSGGGARAAALAYGVLQQLAETHITTSTGSRRLLDEIDVISSVSGGSFTNAYFGLFGDGIFDDFKENMLLRPIEDDLIKGLLNPINWRDLSSPYFGRSDLAANYYDKHIFKGKTFADINSSSPWIFINASDIGTGQRMVFTRHLLNLLCNDFDSYPISRAVAASSGVPGATTPIAIKNHAGSCGYTLPEGMKKELHAQKDPMMSAKINSYLDYLDAEKHPWLHLVDGGITDNLGLRQFYEFASLGPDFERYLGEFAGGDIHEIKEILIISVNAAVEHRVEWAKQPEIPTERQTLGAMTHIQMRNYTADTLHIVRKTYQDWQNKKETNSPTVNFQFVEVAFSQVSDKEERAYLNTLPTSMQLNEKQVDSLIEVGRRLLRDSPDFQQFLARHQP